MSLAVPIWILLVEDNPLDARATIKAVDRLKIANRIEVVTDGDAAIARLSDSGRPRPDLVLLDLDLPGKNGLDVLAVIKNTPEVKRVPVVVLTTSDDDADVISAYDLGANAFVTKPVDLDGWHKIVEHIEGFWFSVVKLPPA